MTEEECESEDPVTGAICNLLPGDHFLHRFMSPDIEISWKSDENFSVNSS